MVSKKVIEYDVRGVKILIEQRRGVYMPSAASLLLAKNLTISGGERVLDLGTGSGFLAILASKLGAHEVIATDISKKALEAARRNVSLNNVNNLEFRQGAATNPLKEKFST